MFKCIPQADAIFMKVRHDPFPKILLFVYYLPILIDCLSAKTCASVKIKIVQSRVGKNKSCTKIYLLALLSYQITQPTKKLLKYMACDRYTIKLVCVYRL